MVDVQYRNPISATLLNQHAISRMGRFARLSRFPFKMVHPRILKFLNRTHRRKATTFWGEEMTVVLPEAVSVGVWRYGFFEFDVCMFMLQTIKEGMNVLDIGAHYGFFTLLAQRLVGSRGRVLAFEPTPSTFAVLTLNTENHNNITIHNYAAYNMDGDIVFFDYGLAQAGFNSAAGIRKQQISAECGTRIQVQARRVDSIIEQEEIRVDCIKIDAESSEMEVLLGLIATLEKHRPAIIIELGDFDGAQRCKSVDIVRWLTSRGYVPYEFAGKMIPHQERESYPYCNLLFLPDGTSPDERSDTTNHEMESRNAESNPR